MKIIFTILIAISFLSIASIKAQVSAPDIEWQNTIGGSGDDQSASIRQTSDGGYIIGGSSSSGISGDKTEPSMGGFDYWIVKLDSSGLTEWQNTIGGNLDDVLFCIRQTSDEGYILAGTSYSGISGDKTQPSFGNEDYWIVKLDASGNIEWQTTLGGDNFDYPITILQTMEGGYIVGGASASGYETYSKTNQHHNRLIFT